MTFEPDTIRVLVVDDEPGDTDLNKAILESAGFQVETAANAREARMVLGEKSCPVLLVDLRLPDGDGLELLDSARARDPQAVAVVLTGFASVDSAVAAIKAGAYDFLVKPCSHERLVEAIRRASERYLLAKGLSERAESLEMQNAALDHRVQGATEEIFELNERLRRYVRQLVETNGNQTRYLEDMAHELKNPLCVVLGYASYLLRRPTEEWKPDELRRSLESIFKNAEHLNDLIEELLDSTRLASRKIKLKRERLSAAQVVRDAVDGMRLRAEERGIRLDADLPQSALQVSADPTRLKQILNNLIGNALKFTPQGGRILVRARTDDGAVRVTVSDTGRGMSSEELERIFERFYQTDASRQDTNKGLGLGLSIVHGLVRLHGGRIWAESTPGRGTKFHFTIPARRKPPAEDESGETVVIGTN